MSALRTWKGCRVLPSIIFVSAFITHRNDFSYIWGLVFFFLTQESSLRKQCVEKSSDFFPLV